MSILTVEAASTLQLRDGWLTYDPRSPTRDEGVVKLFTKLAHAQRGKPERAMLRVQKANGGGVLSPVAEHVGDLTHRMAAHVKYGHVSRREMVLTDNVLDKAEKTRKWLTHPYGFEREHRENIRDNAREAGVDRQEYRVRVDDALDAYRRAHMELDVYNEAQFLARYAAEMVGSQLFASAAEALRDLIRLIKSPHWEDIALSYHKGRDGKVTPIRGHEAATWPKGPIDRE